MIKQPWLWIRIFWIAAKRLFREKYTYRASALAFTTLLALVPLLSVIVSLISLFPFFARFMELARKYILENFIPTSGATIEFYLENFIHQATKLPTFGLIFLFFTVVTLIITVEHTLNEIWGAPKRKKKILIWILYWTILIFAPVLIGLSVFSSTYLFSLSWVAGVTNTLRITAPLLTLIPLLINAVLFSSLYIIVPNYKVKWRDGFFGGLIAALLFELAKFGFALYVKQFPSYELIYGAFATIPIFLMWIYISWLIILYGALVTQTKYQFYKR